MDVTGSRLSNVIGWHRNNRTDEGPVENVLKVDRNGYRIAWRCGRLPELLTRRSSFMSIEHSAGDEPVSDAGLLTTGEGDAGQSHPGSYPQESLDRLDALIRQTARLLPAQGPITAFVFLNTLEGLEHLPFDAGVEEGARLFGCQPYLDEDFYRDQIKRGRIHAGAVRSALRDDLGDAGTTRVIQRTTRYDLRLAMLTTRLRVGRASELRWFVAETNALNEFRAEAPEEKVQEILSETRRWALSAFEPSGEQRSAPLDAETRSRLETVFAGLPERFGRARMGQWNEATWIKFSLQSLWRMCRAGVEAIGVPFSETGLPPRLRDLLLRETQEDVDVFVHETLVRFCAAFTDQGFARWELPDREAGLFQAFCATYAQGFGPPDLLFQGLGAELVRVRAAGLSPLEAIHESLDLLGVPESEWRERITAKLIALRGWAGLIHQMDVRSDRVARPVPKDSLIEFLALRLILERVACLNLAKSRLGFGGSLADLRARLLVRYRDSRQADVEPCAFELYQLAQLFGWSAGELFALTTDQWQQLVREVDGFRPLDRQKILHHAYEAHFRTRALDAIALHARSAAERRPSPPTVSVPPAPAFQAAFCIDTREESLRRYIEEVCPAAETIGVAGFFGIPIYFRGIAEANYSTLCPVVIRPKHWVTEEPVYTLEQQHQRRARTRQMIGTATHRMHMGSRGAAGAALLTMGVGVLASIPLVFRVLFPRLTARIRKRATNWVNAPNQTRLRIERVATEPGPALSQIGFTVDEMATMSARTLRDMGLTQRFAPIVLFFGHGSFCLNNPHKSAYDCGACSGSMGGANARTLAMMLNDPRVRDKIAREGLVQIPATTHFVGALHNTCNDTFTYFDLDLLPPSHRDAFDTARLTLDEAAKLNAQERCRRFESAALNLSPEAAHRHVDGRSEDLAQTRPEYGNSTNAMAVVGRRERTRGLYLDRRSFLVSYDPTQDDADFTTLGRLLGAVVPVCEGINLQYYFSRVDSTGWGCGSKLPHNVTSLLGVMDGAASDMRMGLPWQGVDIHEPMRLLMVIESVPEAIEKIMARNEQVRQIIANGWVQLALLSPAGDDLLLYRKGRFEPYALQADHLPQAANSREWYRGVREHLEFCELTGATGTVSTP
jgi:uncharacterized protein